MANAFQITKLDYEVPKLATGILALFGRGFFIVSFDQGHLFSPVYGTNAFDDLYLHELYHDMRHAAGYLCH